MNKFVWITGALTAVGGVTGVSVISIPNHEVDSQHEQTQIEPRTDGNNLENSDSSSPKKGDDTRPANPKPLLECTLSDTSDRCKNFLNRTTVVILVCDTENEINPNQIHLYKYNSDGVRMEYKDGNWSKDNTTPSWGDEVYQEGNDNPGYKDRKGNWKPMPTESIKWLDYKQWKINCDDGVAKGDNNWGIPQDLLKGFVKTSTPRDDGMTQHWKLGPGLDKRVIVSQLSFFTRNEHDTLTVVGNEWVGTNSYVENNGDFIIKPSE